MKRTLLSLVALASFLPPTLLHAAPWGVSDLDASLAKESAVSVAVDAVAAETAADLKREAVLVDGYAQEDFQADRSDVRLKRKDVAARRAAVAVLRDYSELINAVAAGQSPEEVTKRSGALKQSMVSLKAASSVYFASTAVIDGSIADGTMASTTLNPQQVRFVLQGLDEATRSLTRRKTRRQLAPVVEKADPAVQKLCALLEADLTDITIQVASEEQSKTMRRSQPLLKLVSLSRGSENSLEGVEQATSALKRLAEEHQKLAQGEKI